MQIHVTITASVAAAGAARGQPPKEDSAIGIKDGENADLCDDDTDADPSGIPDDNNNNDLEPMRACYDPFPTAAVLGVSDVGAEKGADALPEEYREDDLLFVAADALPEEYREDDLLFVAWRRIAVVNDPTASEASLGVVRD